MAIQFVESLHYAQPAGGGREGGGPGGGGGRVVQLVPVRVVLRVSKSVQAVTLVQVSAKG